MNLKGRKKIQLKKLEQDDFFLVHVDCIIGLLRYNRNKYIGLVSEIAKMKTDTKSCVNTA